MKFHIINFIMVCAVALSGCSWTNKEVAPTTEVAASADSPVSQKVVIEPTPTIAYSTAAIRGAALVFQRGHSLAAISLQGGAPTILRQQCVTADYGLQGRPQWDFSPDGKRLVFAAVPSDVDFFDAGAIRHYVFTVNTDQGQKVVLAAYGKKEVASEVAPYERPDFPEARFDASGRRLVAVEGQVPHMMDDPCGSWVSIWDVSTRKRVFDGRQIIQESSGKANAVTRQMSSFSAPVLSPDGNDIVCLGTDRKGNTEDGNSTEITRTVHFDLRREKAEVLSGADGAEFVWHPTRKKFLFVGPALPTGGNTNLFAFDLQTRQTTQITQGAHNNFSPQWSLDGKQIYWIRGSVEAQKAGINRVWRADADGSNATAILPQITGATRIQLLPHLADWGRYGDIPIAPRAGADK